MHFMRAASVLWTADSADWVCIEPYLLCNKRKFDHPKWKQQSAFSEIIIRFMHPTVLFVTRADASHLRRGRPGGGGPRAVQHGLQGH